MAFARSLVADIALSSSAARRSALILSCSVTSAFCSLALRPLFWPCWTELSVADERNQCLMNDFSYDSPAVPCSCHPGLVESAEVPGLCPLRHSLGGYVAAEGLEAFPHAAPTAYKVERLGPADFHSQIRSVTACC